MSLIGKYKKIYKYTKYTECRQNFQVMDNNEKGKTRNETVQVKGGLTFPMHFRLFMASRAAAAER